MISQLTGTVRHLTTEKMVLEVGGVGYALSITPRTSTQIVMGSVITLSTSLVVREDSMTLFGFLDMHDRDIYETLQTVSGIGPKVALAITGALTPAELAQAIASEDIASIEKVPGIGKKGAQRLILELKGKLVTDSSAPRVTTHSAVRDQLLAALTGLGFSAKESDTAINNTLSQLAENGEDPAALDVASLLKLTLQSGKR
ncbi:RuvA Holliday junction resolvasome, DNA-binding subunit [Candidatus Nanopelagicaceae bacterium]